MKRILPFLIVLGLLTALGVWWFSPKQVLKRRADSLLSTLTMDEGTGKGGRQLAVYSLNKLLASEVELETPTIEEANGTFDRSELESAFSWLGQQAKRTKFELEDLRRITIDGEKATMKLTLQAVVVLPTYRPADGTFDVTFDWVKEKDGWRLARAVWNQVP